MISANSSDKGIFIDKMSPLLLTMTDCPIKTLTLPGIYLYLVWIKRFNHTKKLTFGISLGKIKFGINLV